MFTINYKSLENECEDPFVDASQDIVRNINTFVADFDRWDDLLTTTNTAATPEFGTLTANLKLSYKALSNSLKCLDQIVSKIQTNRRMYPSITTVELNRRRRFVGDKTKIIKGIKNTICSDRTKRIVAQHQRELLSGFSDHPSNTTPLVSQAQEIIREQNDAVIEMAVQAQEFERQEQDEIVDDILLSVKRLNIFADDIGVEIKEQDGILDAVDAEIDVAQSRMDQLMNSMDKLMQHSDRGKLCTIFVLMIVLGFLIYLVFGRM